MAEKTFIVIETFKQELHYEVDALSQQKAIEKVRAGKEDPIDAQSSSSKFKATKQKPQPI